MLLLLLSRFSRVRLCATPQIAACQAPPSLGSPGKNTGVGCHFLLQCMTVKSESEVAQSCLTLSDPMDCSPPGSSIHGIFQARVLEWGAIAFSEERLQGNKKKQLFFLRQKHRLSHLQTELSTWRQTHTVRAGNRGPSLAEKRKRGKSSLITLKHILSHEDKYQQ